jgi:hypothetical protein
VQQLTDTQLLLGVSAVTYNPDFEHFASPNVGNVDLGRWQPDFILVSWKRERIAAVDLTRQSDVLSVQLEEAYRSKKRKYGPVISALHHYICEGWTIKILKWVICISGLADTVNLKKALSFLDSRNGEPSSRTPCQPQSEPSPTCLKYDSRALIASQPRTK